MDKVEQENKVEENKDTEKKNDLSLKQEVNSSEDQEETGKDINWKKFKEARQLEREQAAIIAKKAQEKEAEAIALKAALESVLNKNQPQDNSSFSNNGFDEETEDQRIEKKLNALLAQREAQSERLRKEQEQRSYPERLRQVHSDIDQICSSANLDYLEYHHPELARSLGSREDGFDKWNDIYNAVKRYIPNLDSRKDQMKAENNFKKPQSLSSPGVTQGGNAMPAAKLDEKRKSENWARMQRVLKGLN